MTRSAALLLLAMACWGCAASQPLQRLRRVEPYVVVAHRGASADCPENTEVAFRTAVEAGAQMVEFDVRQSKDGVWVCMHDATLDRTTDAQGQLGRSGARVDQLTLAELRQLDAGSWFGQEFAGARVATLEEALAAIAPAVAMIEHKGGDPRAMADELRRLDAVEDVLVQSFDWDWLEQLHALEPRLLLGALGGDDPSTERLDDLERTGARVVHWSHRRLTDAAARRVLDSGRLLCAYTVDEEAAFGRCLRRGCHMVTTNRPAHFVRLGRAGGQDGAR